MNITVRQYREEDLPSMIAIWNEVIDEGDAFPQETPLCYVTGSDFFASQTCSAVAVDGDTGEVMGLYILHPNNIGRCGHICNASYAVGKRFRGMHIGEKLVGDCIIQARQMDFRIMQFNAVVASNLPAKHLYERLGFSRLGTIPGGFKAKNGRYVDICLYYRVL